MLWSGCDIERKQKISARGASSLVMRGRDTVRQRYDADNRCRRGGSAARDLAGVVRSVEGGGTKLSGGWVATRSPGTKTRSHDLVADTQTESNCRNYRNSRRNFSTRPGSVLPPEFWLGFWVAQSGRQAELESVVVDTTNHQHIS